MRYHVIMLFCLLSLSTFAQEGFKGEHFIEVTGTAEMEIDPNEITLLIRLREFEENRAKVQLEKLDKEFLDALKSAGIDKKRLTLADAGSKLSKFRKKDKDAFREKAYQLVLTSGGELENFLESIEPVKVEQVMITKVHHTDLEKHKLNLKVKALQAARTKAEMLLQSIGAEIGKPIMVREWEQGPIRPLDMYSNVVVRQKAMGEAAAIEEPEISFKKIQLHVQLTAQFGIQ